MNALGFKAEAGLVLPGVSPAHFMAVALGPVTPSGTVAYHEAFQVCRFCS